MMPIQLKRRDEKDMAKNNSSVDIETINKKKKNNIRKRERNKCNPVSIICRLSELYNTYNK